LKVELCSDDKKKTFKWVAIECNSEEQAKQLKEILE